MCCLALVLLRSRPGRAAAPCEQRGAGLARRPCDALGAAHTCATRHRPFPGRGWRGLLRHVGGAAHARRHAAESTHICSPAQALHWPRLGRGVGVARAARGRARLAAIPTGGCARVCRQMQALCQSRLGKAARRASSKGMHPARCDRAAWVLHLLWPSGAGPSPAVAGRGSRVSRAAEGRLQGVLGFLRSQCVRRHTLGPPGAGLAGRGWRRAGAAASHERHRSLL
jgi:hypothetical protein